MTPARKRGHRQRMPTLLNAAELDRRLPDLPGVTRGRLGTLVLALTAPSFGAAVRLVERVAEQAEQADHHPDIDLRWRTVTFTFSTHSAGGVSDLDLDLAQRVLLVAAEIGATVQPPPPRVEIALDVVDADRVRPFWRAALGYAEQRPAPANGTDAASGPELQDPSGRGPVLWFQRMDPPRTGRGRFHLDVYLPAEEVHRRLTDCLEAGGTLVSEAHAPSWWVLADPEGNEVCLCTHTTTLPPTGVTL